MLSQKHGAPVIEAREVSIVFNGKDPEGRKAEVHACNKVSLSLQPGEIVALVGESGSGKTTLARAMSRLVPPLEGEVLLHGKDIYKSYPRLAFTRTVQLIYQDPFGSLNSLKTIRHILGRAIRIHNKTISSTELTQRIKDLLELVALTPADEFIDRYPSALSGGQRQRISIARALAVEPDILLADEPTSMLDVSIRLDILNLLDKIRKERGVSILYITHDIASARYVSDRMCVMYSGEMVESGPTEDVVRSPQHPYTQLLLASAPDPTRMKPDHFEDLEISEPADPSLKIPGCRFNPRCPKAVEQCVATRPPVFHVAASDVKCWLYKEASQ